MNKSKQQKELSATETVQIIAKADKNLMPPLSLVKRSFKKVHKYPFNLFAKYKHGRSELSTISAYLRSLGINDKWLIQLVHRYQLLKLNNQINSLLITNDWVLPSKTVALMLSCVVVILLMVFGLIWYLPIQPQALLPLYVVGFAIGRLTLVTYERTILHKRAIRELRERAPWLFMDVERK